MKKHSQMTLALMATTLSACTLQNLEQPILAAGDRESVTCKKEAPIDSHVKVFSCRPVNKVNAGSESTAISADPGQQVVVPEGKCGSE